MAEQETKTNNNKTMIAIICVVVVIVLVVALVFAFTGKKSNNNETANSANDTATTQQGGDYSSRLAAIQEKIDAQQKVIDDLNNEMTPLIEQRTALEEQLMKLTLPDDAAVPAEPAAVEPSTEKPAE